MQHLKKILLSILCAISILFARPQQVAPNISDPRLDFALPDANGNSVQLSSMKGKVFLLDFWASWCVPCRFFNKELVKIYSKYKGKGFEILGVSIDDSKKDWKRAVSKDKITWMQINDTNGWDAVAAIKWGVDAIPESFLIDANGNVVVVNPEKKDLEAKLKELLGK
jgi:thiol-disulfide isomerase/thioredoxin